MVNGAYRNAGALPSSPSLCRENGLQKAVMNHSCSSPWQLGKRAPSCNVEQECNACIACSGVRLGQAMRKEMQATVSITVKITMERGLSKHKEKQNEKEEKHALPLCYLRYSNPTVIGAIFFHETKTFRLIVFLLAFILMYCLVQKSW